MPFTTRNNATSLLAGSLTAGATSLSVTPGEGAKFPSPTAGDWFPLTLAKANGTLEIVRATARSGDVITITRAQEGTAAQAFSAGDRVELRVTAAVFTELQTKTSDAQTAANNAQTSANNAQTSANNAQTTVDSLSAVAVRRDSATGAAILPGGTTAQRPASPSVGMERWNSDLGEYEHYYGSAWVPKNSTNKAFNEAPITNLASAPVTNIGAATSNTINITGATTIVSFDNVPAGARRTLVFNGASMLTHSAAIILPTGANITPSAGDVAEFVSTGFGNWRCTSYQRVSGDPVKAVDTKRLATAWVNFNGNGTPVIRGSYNVSSVISNGAGDYSINFITPMDNTNYTAVGMANVNLSNAGYRVAGPISYGFSTFRAGVMGPVTDVGYFDCVIFGGKN